MGLEVESLMSHGTVLAKFRRFDDLIWSQLLHFVIVLVFGSTFHLTHLFEEMGRRLRITGGVILYSDYWIRILMVLTLFLLSICGSQ